MKSIKKVLLLILILVLIAPVAIIATGCFGGNNNSINREHIQNIQWNLARVESSSSHDPTVHSIGAGDILFDNQFAGFLFLGGAGNFIETLGILGEFHGHWTLSSTRLVLTYDIGGFVDRWNIRLKNNNTTLEKSQTQLGITSTFIYTKNEVLPNVNPINPAQIVDIQWNLHSVSYIDESSNVTIVDEYEHMEFGSYNHFTEMYAGYLILHNDNRFIQTQGQFGAFEGAWTLSQGTLDLTFDPEIIDNCELYPEHQHYCFPPSRTETWRLGISEDGQTLEKVRAELSFEGGIAFEIRIFTREN
ncbi:MAG: hypothetical protein FWE01_00575 [Firmicutes bacterium]|nr:hypothetical protein [Bacillota bacterium]